ncbi:MAG: hypothetical protein R3323_01105 [Wenzhouxiangellaceae bacterium]|nr:hypothetical protein [Wenzhouxiangellaceae bacterium]
MKTESPSWFRWLVADLGRYVLVPLLAALLPAGAAGRLLRRAACWRWMCPDRADVVSARRAAGLAPEEGARPWQATMLYEAMSAWRLMLGRRPGLRMRGEWPQRPGFVAAGGHYGNGIIVLWCLREAGLGPRFQLRRPDRGWLRPRPVYYAWSRLRFALIRRLCPDGVITTGGARSQLERAFADGGSTPVVLFDTPAASGSWRMPVGERELPLPTGARDLLRGADVRGVLFFPRICWDASPPVTELEVVPMGSGEEAAESFPQRFGEELARHPGAWHFWPIIEPYLRRAGEPDEAR